jgi:glycosyltransferase involved in cell wall biosynthesis
MNGESPLVSVITIVYNGEKHLLGCINSVKNQGYQNYEHIIVDGNSKDNTLSLLKASLHDRMRYISESDEGISDAFNKGVRLAKGEIIAILNVDDLFDNNTIINLVNFYLNNGAKSGLYYGDITYFNGEISYHLKSDITKIWKYMSLFHPSCFVTRDVYEQYGYFDVNFKYAMDCELIHRFISHSVEFFYVQDLNVNFRLDGHSDKSYKKSLREFYESSRKYNYKPSLEFYYRWSLFKKIILKSPLGKYLQPVYRRFA